MTAKPPVYLRFPAYFAVFLCFSTYRVKPWTWRVSGWRAILFGVAVEVGIAALLAWLLAASARLVTRLAQTGRPE